MTIKPPIIVSEGGDLEVYETVSAAALDLEAIDVLNDEYVIYDAEGTVLEASASSVDSLVEIRLPAGASREPSKLRGILQQFIRAVGIARFQLSEEQLDGINLSELIGAVKGLKRA